MTVTIPPKESDAIRSTNLAKKGIQGNDAIVLPIPDSSVNNIRGNDNTEESSSGIMEETLILTPSQLKAYIQAGVNQEMRQVNSQITQLNQQIETISEEKANLERHSNQQKTDLEKQIEFERRQKNTLSKVFTEFGYSIPSDDPREAYIAPRTNISAKDAAREFMRILDDKSATPTAIWSNPQTGETFLQKDSRHAQRFMRQHREPLRDGIENYAKKHGLLRGKTSFMINGQDAATARTDIPPAFLDYLSSFLRMSHSPKYIFHQFANTAIEIGKGEGDTIQVARVAYAETGTVGTDWELTPGIAIISDSQPITASSVSIVLKEYGMGKNTAIRPIEIPEFILAQSLIQLEQALQRNLGHNYNEFEDISLRNLWIATTRVVYNKLDSIVTNSTSVLVGNGGTFTYKFLNALYAYMSSLQIPAYQNGKYGIVLHSNAIAQLKNNLSTNNQYLNRDNLTEITNIFNAATQSELDKVDGYEGDIANFMVFSTNAISLGVAGTPGAQTETIGGAANITRASFAFGADTFCKATGMPMEIRQDDNTDFQRRKRYIWKSHEGFGALDIDPALNANQQLRVIEIHTTDVTV